MASFLDMRLWPRYSRMSGLFVSPKTTQSMTARACLFCYYCCNDAVQQCPANSCCLTKANLCFYAPGSGGQLGFRLFRLGPTRPSWPGLDSRLPAGLRSVSHVFIPRGHVPLLQTMATLARHLADTWAMLHYTKDTACSHFHRVPLATCIIGWEQSQDSRMLTPSSLRSYGKRGRMLTESSTSPCEVHIVKKLYMASKSLLHQNKLLF